MKKTLRNDLILIGILLALIIGGLLAVLLTRKKNNLVAKIYVQSQLIQEIEFLEGKELPGVYAADDK